MGFSIALERSLVAEINRYADAEGRNRNQQIRWMLLESLGERAKARAISQSTAMNELPHKSSKPLPEKMSQADIEAGITPAQAAKLAECARIGREERLAREAGRDLKQA